jgi:hypothetical protein
LKQVPKISIEITHRPECDRNFEPNLVSGRAPSTAVIKVLKNISQPEMAQRSSMPYTSYTIPCRWTLGRLCTAFCIGVAEMTGLDGFEFGDYGKHRASMIENVVVDSSARKAFWLGQSFKAQRPIPRFIISSTLSKSARPVCSTTTASLQCRRSSFSA